MASNVPQRTYQVVMAATKSMGIAKDGKLPWNLPTDRKFLEEITTSTSDPTKINALVMGRKSWETIPTEDQMFRGCLCIVLTRSTGYHIAKKENVLVCGSMGEALELLAAPPYCHTVETVFNLGGGEILRDTLNVPRCDAIHITEIEADMECDTFMPRVDFSMFQPWSSSFPLLENNIRYFFVTYVRVCGPGMVDHGSLQKRGQSPNGDAGNGRLEGETFSHLPKTIFEKHEEFEYLRLIQEIITNRVKKTDSNGTTLSKFGVQMRFNLRKSFPLLTTKRVSWKGIVEEVLLLIRSSTNSKVLQDQDVHPSNPSVLENYCKRYKEMYDDYSDKGFDRLPDVINKIKNDPDSRRIILPAWYPSDTKLNVPPFHMFAQFYVGNGELYCQLYQSSADMDEEVPLNIAYYSLLTCIIAEVCDLISGELWHLIGDAHVYKPRLGSLEQQLQLKPRPFPVLKINHQKKIDSFVAADFILLSYDPLER